MANREDFAAAVGALIKERSPRDVDTANDLAFAVVDTEQRRTWLEVAGDGGLTEHATDRVRQALGTGGAVPAYPTPDWAHWGDSMTDNAVTGAEAWVAKLAAKTGRDHYNGGWYSQQAAQIAARQGGLPALVSVAGNSIPATGAVAVTAIRNKPVLQNTTRSVTGTMAGVRGVLQEVTTGAVTFARSAPGAATPCPAGTRFIPEDGSSRRDRHVTIWVGRNDVYTTAPQLIVSAVRAQIDYLTPSVKRAMVLEVPPSETSTATHAPLVAINQALQAAFPAEWLPISSWLRTPDAATAAGISFTVDDQADIAAGITPRSFRSDAVHLNGMGCTAVAHRVFVEAQNRGWVA